MKTLLVTLDYPPMIGGVSDYYKNMVKSWPVEGAITVLDNSQGALMSESYPIKWLPSVWNIFLRVRKEKADHILVGQILPVGTASLLASKLLGVKYSVILHGMDFSFATKGGRKKMLARYILENASWIICANSYVAELASGFLGNREKIRVVNPGIDPSYVFGDPSDLKKKYGLENRPVLLSLGRLVKRKGFDTVLGSLPAVIEKFPELVYVIAGAGPESENLKKQVVDSGLGGKVVFTGEVKHEEKMAWFSGCDLFITTSRDLDGDFEGFGIVYLEANLAGKPVIAGNSGGVRDAVIDGVNGFLVDPSDQAEIAEKIVELVQNASLRERMGEQGRKRAVRDFDWIKQAEKIHKLLK